MEAKDTVMSYGGECPDLKKQIFDEIVQAQAEITWKPAFAEGRKAGIKEVVEWLGTKREGGYNFCVKISWDVWNAKLKEWRIE